MALWPFNRRKGSRKRTQGSPGRARHETEPQAPPRSLTEPAPATSATAEPAINKKQKMEATKLQRRQRTYSFSPGRRDSLRVARAQQEPVPPLPTGRIPVGINEKNGDKVPYPRDPDTGHGGASAIESDIMERVPTLHHSNSRNKRRGQPLPRKKSSKRRKEDDDRAAEIKAMSQSHPVPGRAATDNWTKGRSMRRASRRATTGFGKTWDGPDSDVSLPLPESVHSTMSSDSEHVSWRVSALAALAPRPTLRYASNPLRGASSASGPMRSETQRRKFSERGPIPQETLKAHKRIDELADDLGASDIRELMERDKRRRDQKTEKERARLERRLTRKAEKHRADSVEAARNGTPPPQNLERGVMGRDMVGLGIDTTSAVVTSSRRRRSSDTPRQREKRPARSDAEEKIARERGPSPLDNFHRTESMPLESPRHQQPTKSTPVPEPTAKPEPRDPPSPRSPSPRIMGFIRSRKQRSKSPPKPEIEKTDSKLTSTPAVEPSRVASRSDDSTSGGRPSDGSSSRPWASIFKWGRSGKARRSSGPSSFSNTSRDSMQVSQPPQPQIAYIPTRKPSSGVPKRTMSRFREDLPELPMSPPDSRVASPDAEPMPAGPLPIIADDVAMRYETPTSGHRATPSSMHRDELQISPAPMSMSMASVDSEASWLSGRMAGKRASSGMRGSLTNYPMRSASAESEEHEGDDHDITDDDFLKDVAGNKHHRHSVGEGRPSSDDEDDYHTQSPKWGSVKHNAPVVYSRDTLKSREGLLQSFDDDDDEKDYRHSKSSEKDSLEPSEGETPLPQRATSIDFSKRHVRNFSAGSAKLLEIAPSTASERRKSANEPVTQ